MEPNKIIETLFELRDRLGLMLGTGGMALAVMVLISLINPCH